MLDFETLAKVVDHGLALGLVLLHRRTLAATVAALVERVRRLETAVFGVRSKES